MPSCVSCASRHRWAYPVPRRGLMTCRPSISCKPTRRILWYLAHEAKTTSPRVTGKLADRLPGCLSALPPPPHACARVGPPKRVRLYRVPAVSFARQHLKGRERQQMLTVRADTGTSRRTQASSPRPRSLTPSTALAATVRVPGRASPRARSPTTPTHWGRATSAPATASTARSAMP